MNQYTLFGTSPLNLPDVYLKMNTMPEDPEYSAAYGFESENAQNFFMVFPVSGDRSMPYACVEGNQVNTFKTRPTNGFGKPDDLLCIKRLNQLHVGVFITPRNCTAGRGVFTKIVNPNSFFQGGRKASMNILACLIAEDTSFLLAVIFKPVHKLLNLVRLDFADNHIAQTGIDMVFNIALVLCFRTFLDIAAILIHPDCKPFRKAHF